MAKGAKKVVNGETNPEFEECKRLKKLAHSKHLLTSAPATDFTPLSPSKIIVKHHGADILKKSQRKNRYLFSFCGLLAPISGGKIGELTNLGSKNPILYLDFPQGRMKLSGTIVYPNNRYLTLQFSKGGKNVMCEDYFDTMIVFSDACWVGKKDENPQENRLPFPVEIYENSGSDYDFQGGAGSTFVENQSCNKVNKKSVEDQCTESETEERSPDREEEIKKPLDVTPVRHSERNAGKKFKFAVDASSPEDSPGSGDEIFGRLDVSLDDEMKDSVCEISPTQDEAIKPQLQKSAVSGSISKKTSQNGNGKLVQTTISTLLKKVNTKAKQSSSVKKTVPSAVKAGSQSVKKKKIEITIEDESDEDGSDDIEEFSSPSQDTDEDWVE